MDICLKFLQYIHLMDGTYLDLWPLSRKYVYHQFLTHKAEFVTWAQKNKNIHDIAQILQQMQWQQLEQIKM